MAMATSSSTEAPIQTVRGTEMSSPETKGKKKARVRALGAHASQWGNDVRHRERYLYLVNMLTQRCVQERRRVYGFYWSE